MKTKLDLANLKKMPQADYLNEVKSEFRRLKATGESEVIVITDFVFADGKKGSVVIPTDISGASQKFYNDVAKKEYKGFGRGTVNLKDGEQGATMELFIDSGKAKAKALEKGGKKIFEKVGVIPVITKNPVALAEEEPDTAEDNATANELAEDESAAPKATAINNLKAGADNLKEIQALVKGELIAILARAKTQKTLETDSSVIANISQKANSWLEWFNLLKPNEQKQFATYAPQIAKIKEQVDRIGLMDTQDDGVDTSIFIKSSVGTGGSNSPRDVRVVQRLLIKQGFELTVDGQCTEAAIIELQKKAGIKPINGLVERGSATWHLVAKVKIDDAIPQKDGHTFKYGQFALQLFRTGAADKMDIDPNDIAQGGLGDCYFLAALSAVAQTDPEAIRKLIKDNGDGSYDVTLYAKGDKLAFKPTIITVKPQFPVDNKGNPVYAGEGDNELWVMIMEKAYAKLNGDYNGISSGRAENGLEAILGVNMTEYFFEKFDRKLVIQAIKLGIKDKYPMTVSSNGKGEAPTKLRDDATVYGGHAYSVADISRKTISLRNPWGKNHLELSFDEFFTHFYRLTVQP